MDLMLVELSRECLKGEKEIRKIGTKNERQVIEQSPTVRVLLQYCTNNMRQTEKLVHGDQIKGGKGPWK